MNEAEQDQRNDEIRDNIERMRREREAYADALAIVEQFNARLSAKKSAWFWPPFAAALTSKHHWLVIALRQLRDMKPRDPEASVRVALRDVRCPRCNGHGRPHIIALSRYPYCLVALSVDLIVASKINEGHAVIPRGSARTCSVAALPLR